jgi:hypothetical protein
LNPSLSVLLPVYNAQTKLAGMVQRILEVLPELTPQFDLMIVDDGSTDATCEVAYELGNAYPQVAVVRHAKAMGWAPSVAKWAPKVSGEFLMVHCGGEVLGHDIVGLWRLREGIAAAAKARATAARSGKSLRVDPKSGGHAKRQAGAASTQNATGGLGIHARAPRSNLLLIHRQQVAELERSLATLPVSNWLSSQSPARKSGSGLVKSPSFLSRVKAFTLGE